MSVKMEDEGLPRSIAVENREDIVVLEEGIEKIALETFAEAETQIQYPTEGAPTESSNISAPVANAAQKDKGEHENDLNHLEDNPDANKVREWRHKIQGAFLGTRTPTAEEMPEYDRLFTIIENHELTIAQISFSKLGKVMRHISNLNAAKGWIPNEDQYRICARAHALIEKWRRLIPEPMPTGTSAGNLNGSEGEQTQTSTKTVEPEKEPEAGPATNGNVEEDKSDDDVKVTDNAEETLPMDTGGD